MSTNTTLSPAGRGAAATGLPMEQYSRLRVRLGMIEKVEFDNKMMWYTITYHINKHRNLKYQYFNRENNTKFVYLIGQLYTTIRCQFVDTNILILLDFY